MKQSKGLNGDLKPIHKQNHKQDHDKPDHMKPLSPPARLKMSINMNETSQKYKWSKAFPKEWKKKG